MVFEEEMFGKGETEEEQHHRGWAELSTARNGTTMMMMEPCVSLPYMNVELTPYLPKASTRRAGSQPQENRITMVRRTLKRNDEQKEMKENARPLTDSSHKDGTPE